jgi:DNA-binding NtrC family response regulator
MDGAQMSGSLLLVEDTSSLSLVYRGILTRAGHEVSCAYTLEEARTLCAATLPKLVLLDLQLPDGDGLDLLRLLQAEAPEVPVIVITANGSINRAVQAMRAGATDFLVKPFDEGRLINAIQNALADRPRQVVPPAPPETGAEAGSFQGFIGRSDQMADIYRMIGSIGRSTATVFITGESGTGKEVCARAIHALSNRARKPFVPLNCAAIPRDLLESEVFGHLKGAFTGALSDKPGAAAVADGGTLFLDEICEMDLSLQTKLLRFLQTSMIQPVGAARPVSVDVRIVCATNRDPAEEVRAGRFREDLYYRLHVVPIRMPPLRERSDDIMPIAQDSLLKFAAEEGKAFVGFDDHVVAILRSRTWPGNVRQLLNVIRNIVVLHDGPLVTPGMLPTEITLGAVDAGAGVPAALPRERLVAGPTIGGSMASHVGRALSDVEREFIEATIEHCDGSVPRAARMLELSPSTIYRKLESWSAEERREDA